MGTETKLHNHPQDTIYHHDCPRCRLNEAAPALLSICKDILALCKAKNIPLNKENLAVSLESAIALAEPE